MFGSIIHNKIYNMHLENRSFFINVLQALLLYIINFI